ncbi:hypothetical protein [Nostoc sp. C052]|uniref:hypothetical protein n=1 Tax=Nostoc sp. C052 TaxID=2576902 RepID=UPI0015C30D3C|nr:hypothetical protein [Nostoc sp. C052]
MPPYTICRCWEVRIFSNPKWKTAIAISVTTSTKKSERLLFLTYFWSAIASL